MPKIKYEECNMRPAKLARIAQANEIIAEYEAQGFTLTLRQLYYQFVARGVIANNEKEYKNLGSTIADGRLAGLIDWEAITDRTRYLRKLAHWNSPAEIVGACANQFRFDKWNVQPYYVEVWIEKDALIGVIEGLCEELDVPYLACRGYASASEVWRAGHERFRPRVQDGKKGLILYLGDHDPSGIDMSRDVNDRIDLFTGKPGAVEVKRLALNMDQVEQYNPPPNPTKLTDSRATDYIMKYGETCWELDALSPPTIAALVRDAVNEVLNTKRWKADVKLEDKSKNDLGRVAANWNGVVQAVDELEDDRDE